MLVWIVLTVMAALAAVAVAIPLVRRHDAPAGERGAVTGVLRDELAELERQVASGAVAQADAAGLRAELQRRLLAEARVAETAARPLSEGGRARVAFGAAGLVALAAAGLYAYLGRPDLAGRAVAPAAVAPPAGAQTAEVAGLIGQLETRVAATPGDPEGWRLLGWSYVQTGRFDDAARAYARAAALAPDDAAVASALGEAQVAAASGVVTPDARASFARARALDADDVRARYYLALAKDQAGDRAAALAEWRALLRAAPADAPYTAELRRTIAQSAAAQGVDLGDEAQTAPGPSAADVAAASAMPAADRAAMVRGMVDGLAARLAAEPNDADGWERLIRARMVLGEPAAAAKALADAERAFAGDAATRARLRAAARALGVPAV